jgi:hypothetical protein
MRHNVLSPERAVAFVAKEGVVLESGRGLVPSLAAAIAGAAIRGSWWAHPRRGEIFRATRAVRDSADVLVCRLLDDKITYVHRRLWPALVRLAPVIGSRRLDALREDHTGSGAHRVVVIAFPHWVPGEVTRAAERLSEAEARNLCGGWLVPGNGPKSQISTTRKRSDGGKRRAP